MSGILSLLRPLKLAFLRLAQQSGVDTIVLRSRWRRKRLSILCYHGISLADEHEWTPLYVPPAQFRKRMEILRERRCNVLPLGSALQALREERLPERAVCITFDDGFYDFYREAWPVLQEFGFPATLYLSTYYSVKNLPVFDLMCSYMVWKSSGRVLSWPEVVSAPAPIDRAAWPRIVGEIFRYCLAQKLSGREKHELLCSLAERLDCDLPALCKRRLLHLMTPGEASSLVSQGLDLQLHTHRHRVYPDRDWFWKEIDDNRAELSKRSEEH